MHYTPNGAFIGGERVPARDLVRYQNYRERALAAAVPFMDYWERQH